ncbi:MAG TPA: hypothetical protein VFI73_09460 [Candidatus Nitrosopolaris sp.]|nr:hypothetical protein [Candidatus Nitrosopolaris sp.]
MTGVLMWGNGGSGNGGRRGNGCNAFSSNRKFAVSNTQLSF